MEMSDVYPILVVDTNSLTTSVFDAWTRFAVAHGPDWSLWGMHMICDVGQLGNWHNAHDGTVLGCDHCDTSYVVTYAYGVLALELVGKS